jgi:hypothetical protein
VAASAQSPGDFNTLRVVGGRAQEVCAKVSEGVRVDKLRRDSSFLNTVGTDPGEVRTERSFGAGEISRRRMTARIRRGESRNPADR